MMLWYGCTLCV